MPVLKGGMFAPYHHYGVAHRYRSDDTLAGYYEHRLDAVRFGSQRLWHIYDDQQGGRRADCGGHCRHGGCKQRQRRRKLSDQWSQCASSPSNQRQRIARSVAAA